MFYSFFWSLQLFYESATVKKFDARSWTWTKSKISDWSIGSNTNKLIIQTWSGSCITCLVQFKNIHALIPTADMFCILFSYSSFQKPNRHDFVIFYYWHLINPKHGIGYKLGQPMVLLRNEFRQHFVFVQRHVCWWRFMHYVQPSFGILKAKIFASLTLLVFYYPRERSTILLWLV